MIVFFLGIFLTAALCIASAIAVMFAIYAVRIRTASSIPAQPLLVPTAAEQIPPDMAEFLAEVVPALHELGFVAAASVHAPQLLAMVAWTQVLFLRRDRGDRASVLLLRPKTATERSIAATPPALIFATELSDGRSVKTVTREPLPASGASSSPSPPLSLHDRVTTLYARHRADVEQQLGHDVIGLAPEIGEEIPWLQARAGAVAGNLAEHCGYVAAADRSAYRPPWRVVIRVAWKTLWTRGARRERQGFEVATPPAATPSTSATPNSS
jgi:hypothetical protein